MRFLILSDLHANLEALQAVVDDAAGAYDAVLCLGDIVGYGADPNAVADWIRAHAAATVRGNHDKVAVGLETLEWFNPIAQSAAAWTQAALSPENVEWLRALPKGPLAVGGFQLVHGSPANEDQYLVEADDVMLAVHAVECPLTFFGHTHLQGGFELRPRQILEVKRPGPFQRERVEQLRPDSCYLINTGSVGQPRDRDPRAAYVLYDPAEPIVRLRRVKYDVARAQKKIIAAGLPPLLAERLADGR